MMRIFNGRIAVLSAIVSFAVSALACSSAETEGTAGAEVHSASDDDVAVSGLDSYCCLHNSRCDKSRADACRSVAADYAKAGSLKRAKLYLEQVASNDGYAANELAIVYYRMGNSVKNQEYRQSACQVDAEVRADCPGHEAAVARREAREQRQADIRNAEIARVLVAGAIAVAEGVQKGLAEKQAREQQRRAQQEREIQARQSAAAGTATMDAQYPRNGDGGGDVATGGSCPNSCPTNPSGIRACYEAAACVCKAAMANWKGCCKAGSSKSVCMAQLQQCVTENERNAAGMGSN